MISRVIKVPLMTTRGVLLSNGMSSGFVAGDLLVNIPQLLYTFSITYSLVLGSQLNEILTTEYNSNTFKEIQCLRNPTPQQTHLSVCIDKR